MKGVLSHHAGLWHYYVLLTTRACNIANESLLSNNSVPETREHHVLDVTTIYADVSVRNEIQHLINTMRLLEAKIDSVCSTKC